MASQMIKISGTITVPHLGTAGFQLPFGVTVELTAIAGSTAGAWIGSAPVEPVDHTFDMLVAYPLKTNEQINYAVYKGSVLIQQGQAATTNARVSIPLTEASYNKLSLPEQESYVTLSGKVTLGSEYITAVSNTAGAVKITANKVQFPNPENLGSTVLDNQGNYKIKIPVSKLTGTNTTTDCCDEVPLSKVFITVEIDNVIKQTTDLIEITERCTNFDLHIDLRDLFSKFLSEYAFISNRITTVTGLTENQFYTVSTDVINSGMNSIAATTGLRESQVTNVIHAAGISKDTGVNGITVAEAYVFVRAMGNDRQTIYNLGSNEITRIMTEAAAARIITAPGETEKIYSVFRNMLTRLENAAVTDDGVSIYDLVKNLFTASGTTDADVQYFLEQNKIKDEQNIPAFWQRIEGMSGKPNKERLQAAIPMLAITGLQLETTKALQAAYPGPDNYGYVLKSREDWKNFIEDISDANGGKLCIPAVIRGDVTVNSSEAQQDAVKTAYADRLYETATGLFATKAFGNRLQNDIDYVPGKTSPDKGLLRSKFTNPRQLVNYLNTHADFDFRLNSIWDESLSSMDDASRQVLINDVVPIQNLMRLTGNMPDAVAELLKQNIKGSADIAATDQELFVTNFKFAFKDEATAIQVYTKAAHTAVRLTQIKTQVNASNYLPVYVLEAQWGDWIKNDKPTSPPSTGSVPNLESLFGSMDLCSCSDCMSMYSPAAYFTDLLNFLKNKLGSTEAFTELTLKRRPDLLAIDISCKNANTPMPYVDLVIEMLEVMVLKSVGISTPDSFQTSGTAAELAAYPEHTYKTGPAGAKVYTAYGDYEKVYGDQYPGNNTPTLKNAYYPNTLPFNMPVAESRTYLKHLGYSRQQLMQYFKPTDYLTSTGIIGNGVNDFNAMSELLGLTRLEADIIIANPGTNNYKYYGYETELGENSVLWHDELLTGPASRKGLRFLLERSNISYKEMLQLLDTRFLNRVAGSNQLIFKVVSTDPAAPDTCQLDKLKLARQVSSGTGTLPVDLFNKWHRFIRLWRATGWTVQQLDTVLMSFGNTLVKDTLIYVGKTQRLVTELRIAPEKICSFWSNLDTFNYINYNSDNQAPIPSVYDNLFRNKAISNPTDVNFTNPDTIGGTYATNAGTLIAGTGLAESDLLLLYPYFGTAPGANIGTRGIISRIYALSLVSGSLNISIKDILRTCTLFQLQSNIAGTQFQQADLLELILTKVATLQTLPFTLDEIEYLILNKDDKNQFNPADTAIKDFYETLRSRLKASVNGAPEPYNDALKDLLGKAVSQRFSDQFGLNNDTAQLLLATVLKINSNALLDTLITPDFIGSENAITDGLSTPGGLAYAQLYMRYRTCFKIAMLINTLKLGKEEVKAFQENQQALDITDLAKLPGGPGLSPADSVFLQQLVHLVNWIKVRDRLNLSTGELTKLLYESNGTGTRDGWQNKLVTYADWNLTDLKYLTGTSDPVPNNILKVQYSNLPAQNNFRYAQLILQIADIVSATTRIGLSTQGVYASLLTDVTTTQSGNIRKAAKAKHDDEAWAKMAKPLQDTLREGQRAALVDYVMYTKTINDGRWKDENDLYAYLLIDVEMKPCMKTSRIKQAISSIQLFMDRVVMKLENVGGNPSYPIYLPADKVAQWKSWRKWYRIWEANRKVFLYPENWIEPDLRDDKTPFFKELETQLLQDEVTDKTAANAMLSYLERVSEVGRLEPVNAYHEVDLAKGVDIRHVFARTHAEPHRYYYRKLENNEWTPWEKVNVDIKSDHVTPVIWNKRLFLFWTTFQKKKTEPLQRKSSPYPYWANLITSKNQAAGNPMDITKDDRETAWEIKLNWSQYKDGKWLATEVAKDTMIIFPERIRVTIKKMNTINAITPDLFRKWVKNGDTSIPEIFRDRIFLYVTNDSPLYPKVDMMCISLVFPPGLDEAGVGLYAFIFPDGGQPYVLRNNNRGHQVLAPKGTRFDRMKFAQIENFEEIGKLWIDSDTVATERDKHFLYEADYLVGEWDPNITYALSSRNTVSSVLFNKVDNAQVGRYRISSIADSAFGPNPVKTHFFYEDNKHTFYAQRVLSQPASSGVIRGLTKAVYTDMNKAMDLSKLIYSSGTQTPNSPSTGIQPVASTVQYRFQTFYHAQITDFVRSLNRAGIPGLLQLSNQSQSNTMDFPGTYLPTNMVSSNYPGNNVQFGFSDPMGIYNWEIFFHSPMMIAQRLADNQQFEEAQKWYHYIFDPTSSKDMNGANTTAKKRFWKFFPFYNEAQQTNVQTLVQLLAAINANAPEAVAQVKKWEQNPFKPHVIARMRILAYMKNVVMKYLDNLVAWGDQLFRRDTIESINEATQLYVLAANILGRRPEEIPARAQTDIKSFDELGPLDALSNAMVNIESYFSPNAGPLSTGGIPGKEGDHGIEVKMFYFCLPNNDKLLAYWNTVADRLFKIRNCMNIEGSVRELPLYEPPIDPALLVRAAAMGISMDTIQNNKNAPVLPYRFSYVLQKAGEFCGEVRALGGALLSAIEKKDAEQLALLRSGHELRLLEKVKGVKEAQVQEAEANLEASRRSRENAQIRQRYYSTRAFMNSGEQQHLESVQTGLTLQVIQGVLEGTAGALSAIPTGHFQGTSSGASFGGLQLANVMRAASSAVGIAVMVNNARGSMALTRGGYERRRDDWAFQAESAAKEIEQADKQILAAEIRLDIANRDLSNHDLQMEQSAETDSYMRSKFSNQELYTWMVNQVAATYFQAYQLAYDLARNAEKCFDLELPSVTKPGNGFIQFGYWDSLRKGLMSGEKLQLDLRKMEVNYMQENKRELELTKNISLSLTDPKAILDLRSKGVCKIYLPEELFDLDYPGHFNRRIKSVSLSIPCIAGPYTTIPATLSLKNSYIRKKKSTAPEPDPASSSLQCIATSTAQNDSGLFELNFRDERYLPFEGKGAISEWELSLLANVVVTNFEQPRMFNFDTISDVILHVRYTAQEGDADLKKQRLESIKTLFTTPSTNPTVPASLLLPRYFSLKHEFSNEWYDGFNHLVKINNGAGALIGHKLDLKLSRSQFPEYTAGRKITIDKAYLYVKNSAAVANLSVEYKNGVMATVTDEGDYKKATISSPALTFEIGNEAALPFPVILYNGALELKASDLNDVFLVLHYKL